MSNTVTHRTLGTLLMLTLTHCAASVDPNAPDDLSAQEADKGTHAGTVTQWASTCNSGSVPWRIIDTGATHLKVTYHIFANNLDTFGLNRGAEFLIVAIPERDNTPSPRPWIAVKLDPTQDPDTGRIGYTVLPDVVENISMEAFSLQPGWISRGLRRPAATSFSVLHRSKAKDENGQPLDVGANAEFSCPRNQVPQIETRIRTLISHNIPVVHASS